MQEKPHLLMAILAVSPKYQRAGVGKKLLAWGLKQADALQLGTWIDASPQGLGLYKTMGWREVGHLDID